MATDLTSTDPKLDAERSPGRPRRTALAVCAVVGVLLLGLVFVFANAPVATTQVVNSPLVGRPAPEVVATTIDGDTFDMAELRGQWVVLNVFATWCVPCREEHPHLVRFDTLHRARGDAAVVGLVYDDDAEAVRQFRAEEGGDWPMLTDPDGRIALSLGVAGVPESFIIGPDGVIAAKVTGGVRLDELEVLLERVKDPLPGP